MKNSKCYVKSFGREEFGKNNRIMKEVERVMRKLMVVLVVLAFACGTMLMMSSCAKKQIGTGEAAPAAAPSAPAAAAPSTAGVDKAQEVRAFEPRASTSTLTRPRSKLTQRRSGEESRLAESQSFLQREDRGKLRRPRTNEYNLALGDRRRRLPRSSSMLLELA